MTGRLPASYNNRQPACRRCRTPPDRRLPRSRASRNRPRLRAIEHATPSPDSAGRGRRRNRSTARIGGTPSHSRGVERCGGHRLCGLAVAVVYLAGVALLTLRLLIGMIQAHRLVRRGKQVDLPGTAGRLPGGARVVESAEVLVPVTIGCRRPAVVLPADWKTWSDAWLAMVLAHETEHVRRGDTWVALLAAWNCAVYWFHPVAWLVRRWLAALAEQVCDDAVIRATGSRNEYAQNLLEMAGRLTAASGRLRPAGVAMARTANVVQRIEAILDNDRPLSRKIGAAAGAAAGVHRGAVGFSGCGPAAGCAHRRGRTAGRGPPRAGNPPKRNRRRRVSKAASSWPTTESRWPARKSGS